MTKKKETPKKATTTKKKETPKKATATKKKETPKKATATKKKETPKKATASKKKETPKKATVNKKKEKVDAKSVSTKTSKPNPGKVKDFCNITFTDIKAPDSEIDTGIILSLKGEPKKAVINLEGEFTEVTWWGEGGDPAKDGQISTAGAVGALQINTTTYNEIGDHFVSFEAVSKGTLYRKSVKFSVKM